jgi:hypothetical protein
MAEDDVTAAEATGTETETDTDATTDTGQDGTETEWTPPTREEWDAAQALTEKEKADHARTVERLKSASAESAQRKKAIVDIKKQHETDAEKAQREAEEAAHQRLKPALIPIAAKASLLEADALPHRAAALARLIDMTVVDVSGTDVVGLDAEVTRLKAEYPEFFRSDEVVTEKSEKVEKPKPAAVQVGTRKPAPAALSPMEMLAAQVQGNQKK